MVAPGAGKSHETFLGNPTTYQIQPPPPKTPPYRIYGAINASEKQSKQASVVYNYY